MVQPASGPSESIVFLIRYIIFVPGKPYIPLGSVVSDSKDRGLLSADLISGADWDFREHDAHLGSATGSLCGSFQKFC